MINEQWKLVHELVHYKCVNINTTSKQVVSHVIVLDGKMKLIMYNGLIKSLIVLMEPFR